MGLTVLVHSGVRVSMLKPHTDTLLIATNPFAAIRPMLTITKTTNAQYVETFILDLCYHDII